MKCAEFQTKFQNILDLRETPNCDEQLMAHAAQCEQCQAMLDGWESFSMGFDAQTIPELSSSFADDVVAASLVTQSSTSRFAIASLIAIAAAVLLATIPLDRMLTAPTQPDPVPEIVVVDPKNPIVEDDPIDPAEFAELVERITPWIPEVTPERMAPVDRLAGRFKPVTTSFAVAYETLRQTIPIRRSSDTPKKPQASAAVQGPSLG